MLRVRSGAIKAGSAASMFARSYRRGRRRRFRRLSGLIAEVEVADRFAYAIRRCVVALIDVLSGTVVNRSSTTPPVNSNLLAQPSR